MQDPEKAKRILNIIVEKDGDIALMSQLSGAKLSREDSTPMIFDIHVDESAQKSSRENGPLPVNAEYTQGQGTVMVFIEDGVLAWMEAPWHSDAMPTEWPDPEAMRFYQAEEKAAPISTISIHNDDGLPCRVCGLRWPASDREEILWNICACCGVEAGYQDTLLAAVRRYRERWLADGAKWFAEKFRPADWSLEAQMASVPAEWR